MGRTGRPLSDGLAHFGSNQLHEVAFYIVTRFSNHGGSELGFSMAALMCLLNGFLDRQGVFSLRTNYGHRLLLNMRWTHQS